MRAGQLRRQVTIESRTTTKDTFGQALDTWTMVCTPYADMQPATGREMLAGEALVSQVSSVVEIRYRTDVTAAMRLRYAGRVLNIEAVIDVETRHERLHLMCSEGMNQG
jgi:SPP1 family predicted phage head-tail adaptor